VWGKGEACTWFWLGNVRERDHLEDPGLDGRIILSGMWVMDWIEVAQDRDRSQACVSFGFHKILLVD